MKRIIRFALITLMFPLSAFAVDPELNWISDTTRELVVELRCSQDIDVKVECQFVPSSRGRVENIGIDFYCTDGDGRRNHLGGFGVGGGGIIGLNVFEGGPHYQFKKVGPGVWRCRIEKCIQGRVPCVSCLYSCGCTRCDGPLLKDD